MEEAGQQNASAVVAGGVGDKLPPWLVFGYFLFPVLWPALWFFASIFMLLLASSFSTQSVQGLKTLVFCIYVLTPVLLFLVSFFFVRGFRKIAPVIFAEWLFLCFFSSTVTQGAINSAADRAINSVHSQLERTR